MRFKGTLTRYQQTADAIPVEGEIQDTFEVDPAWHGTLWPTPEVDVTMDNYILTLNGGRNKLVQIRQIRRAEKKCDFTGVVNG